MPFAGSFNVQASFGGITEDNIDSGTAAAGEVLTADGSGGAGWQAASGGGGSGVSIPYCGYGVEKTVVAYTAAFVATVGRLPIQGDAMYLEDADFGEYALAIYNYDSGCWHIFRLSDSAV